MNICKGDYVRWNEPQFTGGSFFRGRCTGAKFKGMIERCGVVEKESYGEKTGQHTFSIRLDDGTLKRVMGRNLYPNLLDYIPGPEHAAHAADKARRAQTQAARNRPIQFF